MKLKELRIELATYGANEGKYTGKIQFTDVAGDITLPVTPELASKLLLASAEGLADVSAMTARTLHEATIASIQAVQPPKSP